MTNMHIFLFVAWNLHDFQGFGGGYSRGYGNGYGTVHGFGYGNGYAAPSTTMKKATENMIDVFYCKLNLRTGQA